MDKRKQINKKRYQKWLALLRKPEDCRTKEEFAKSIGVGSATLYRWEKHPTFWVEVKEYGDKEIPKISEMIRNVHQEKALEGDLPAIKLFYQKEQGWTEKIENKMIHEVNPDNIAEMARKVKELQNKKELEE